MQVLQNFWCLTRSYWVGRRAWPQLSLLAVVLVTSLSSVWFSVKINQWNGDFFNALQALDGETIYPLLLQFTVLVAAYVVVMVYADYLQKKVAINWREWMTREYASRWLSDRHTHYQLQMQHQEPDNPDQRIAADIRLLTEDSLKLLVSFLRSVLTLFSFLGILWQFSTSFEFVWLGVDWAIPGYLVWVCLIYTLAGTWITHRIGNQLQSLNYQQERNEANFRHLLMQQRESSEAIAAQQGEDCERNRLNDSFKHVVHNWYGLMHREKNLSFFTIAYSQVTLLAPIFFALPAFLAGSILLGGLMQVRQAFGQVAGALGWFIYAYEDLASWSATVERLTRFTQNMDRLAPMPATAAADEGLSAAMQLNKADQTPLLHLPQIQLAQSDFLLVEGASGLGKSTLLQALAGHWPNFVGQLSRNDNLFWVPQNLYLPSLSLKELLCYPQPASAVSDADSVRALKQVGLGALEMELEHQTDWRLRLSGGEQQRIMWARVLLNRPRIALMDETTSALDTPSAVELISKVRAACPSMILVLISHQTDHAVGAQYHLFFRSGQPAQGFLKEQEV
ncbi:ABC transporter ATP-binding protein/permease [Halomonas llamarensis]|uniref:ABC transporter ATP-binding protein/permease n=1 Tax=Halomonas llamarensis TaxID=2945104 RepID=A0ABT0SUS2_9GAMM|nr:ABC transporter ATP-binding protein/permease [Halomonas llamarensis]MCL7931386.1 ABC transporter ATP-binding protein/permease [Halomonas llamarensis]